MEVILIQDVPNIGHANDLVKVKDGYARNYLIPKKLAISANESNKKVHAETLKQRAFKEEKIKTAAETLAKALKDITVKIGAKAGTSGKIFGSVNAMQIADAIKEQFKFDVDKKHIHLDSESVKEVGTYNATVKLHREVQVNIKFEVIAE